MNSAASVRRAAGGAPNTVVPDTRCDLINEDRHCSLSATCGHESRTAEKLVGSHRLSPCSLSREQEPIADDRVRSPQRSIAVSVLEEVPRRFIADGRRQSLAGHHSASQCRGESASRLSAGNVRTSLLRAPTSCAPTRRSTSDRPAACRIC